MQVTTLKAEDKYKRWFRGFRRSLLCRLERAQRGDEPCLHYVLLQRRYSALESSLLYDDMMKLQAAGCRVITRRTQRQSTNGCIGWFEWRSSGKLKFRIELHIETVCDVATKIVSR